MGPLIVRIPGVIDRSVSCDSIFKTSTGVMGCRGPNFECNLACKLQLALTFKANVSQSVHDLRGPSGSWLMVTRREL
ncbi:hypothetical protein VTO73DRAFT_12018 [Trametes versicolor]